MKWKCAERQEFVVAGFVPSTTARKAIGSLALGYHRGGKLIHAGRGGTGLTQKVAAARSTRLDKMKQTKITFGKSTSEERRGGNECVSTSRSRWSANT